VQITIGLTILIMGVLKRNYAISIKRLILLLAGMLLPISGVIIFYAWKKALPLLLNAVITYNFSYSGSHIDPFSTLGHGFVILNIVALIALAGYIKVIQEILQRGKASLNERHFILLLGWPVEILLSSLSGRAYNHYFLCWLPMMALLTAYFFFAFGKRVERILTSQPLWLTYVIFLILLVVPSWRGFSIYKNALADVIAGRSPAVAIDPVSTYLHDHSSSNEKAFVWCGQGGIYFMSGREASTAYFLYPMFVNSSLGISLENQFLADLQTHPPALIADVYYLVGGNEVCYSLDPAIREKQMTTVGKKQIIYTAHNIEQVYEFIEQNYHLETKISQAGIYRLNQTLTEGIGVSVLR
jgi:hypothetical protein